MYMGSKYQLLAFFITNKRHYLDYFITNNLKTYLPIPKVITMHNLKTLDIKPASILDQITTITYTNLVKSQTMREEELALARYLLSASLWK